MPKKRGRPKSKIDPDQVRQFSMIGCSIRVIAEHFGCSRDTIEERFRFELEAGKSEGQIRILGKIFQAALNGSGRALELCAVNLCGWTLRPQTIVNVTQGCGIPVDSRTPEQIRQHLVELQRAVLEEALREQAQEAALPEQAVRLPESRSQN